MLLLCSHQNKCFSLKYDKIILMYNKVPFLKVFLSVYRSKLCGLYVATYFSNIRLYYICKYSFKYTLKIWSV